MGIPQKHKFKKSFFFTLLIIFLVLVTCLYTIGFGLYQWGFDMTTNEILQSLDSKTTFFLRTLENEIMRIRQLQYECLNDENLFYYVNASQIMSNSQRTSALLSTKARLKVMYNSSSYIKNASIYIPGMNKMISAVDGVNGITDEWTRLISIEADASEAGITYLDGEMYLCAGYPIIQANPGAAPLYILIIQLSTQDIRELLMSFNMYPEGGTVLANFNQDYHITVGEGSDLASKIKEQAFSDENISDLSYFPVKIDNLNYIVVGKTSEYLNMNFYTYVAEKLIYSKLWMFRNIFIFFSIASFLAIAAFLLSTNKLINKPIKILVHSLKRVEHGDHKIRIKYTADSEFGYLYGAFNDMAASLENMIKINYQQKLLNQRAELKQLQAQINPHFLYNNFFILYRMAKDEDYENITRLLTYLSDYYRYITRNQHMDVPLRDEVMHAYRYAQIQGMRFNKRISVAMEPLPEKIENIMVPKLIIQPLLENAFNHGLKDVEEGGRLSVSFITENATMIIEVKDNGSGMDEAKLEELIHKMESTSDITDSIGVVNIHKRLRLKFGSKYGLQIVNMETGGLCSRIIIPLQTDVSDPLPNEDDK